MKKKPDRPAGKEPDAARRRKELALSRMLARRVRARETAQNERSAVFEKRLKNAPARKAPYTLRTRGYYRFNKDFPGVTDEEGFRENSESKRRVRRRALLWAAALVFAFCFAFVITKAAWRVSNMPPAVSPAEQQTEETGKTPAKWLHFTPEELENNAAGQLLKKLENAGAALAVLEYKDVYGHIHKGTEALSRSLREAGYKTAAYISCFKDTLQPINTPGLGVQTVNGESLYWKDNGGSGWLNPFSAEARTLLLETVASAAEADFDYLLLDNVCFPADAGGAAARYPGEGDYNGTRNQLLTGFVNDAVSAAGGVSTVLMGKFNSFDASASADRPPCYGSLAKTNASLLCADARFSEQQKNLTVGTEKFADAADLPFAFVLAVSELTAANAGETGVLVCVENGGGAAEAVKAAGYSGAKGVIIW